MARKKDLGKTSALSEEYVIDSDSDGHASLKSGVQRDSSTEPLHKSLKKKLEKGSPTSTRSVNETEQPGKADSVDEESEATERNLSRAENSSSDGESQSGASVQAVQKPPKKSAISAPKQVLASIPAKPFRAPAGFQEVKPDEVDVSSDGIQTLAGDLSGKKLWHITAPASIPLKSIETLNADALKSETSVLTYKKRQYCLSNDSNDSNDSAQLLLPRETGKTYKRLKMSVSQSFHLREILQDWQSSTLKENQSPEAKDFVAKKKPEQKPAPKQRAGLKMRYKPFGTGDDPPTPAKLAKSTDPENSSILGASLASSSLNTSTPKKKKKKRKANQPGQLEQGTPGDHSIQPDTSPTRTITGKRPSSQDDALSPDIPIGVSGLGEDTATPGRKKKKKKSREETSSVTL